jgi:phage-related protein (TIGR01555 family)
MFEFLDKFTGKREKQLALVRRELEIIRPQLAAHESTLKAFYVGQDSLMGAFASDGLQNAVAGLGTERDKRSYNDWGFVVQLDRERASSMCRSNWLAKNIVGVRAEDMCRAWVDVQWDGKKEDVNRQQAIDEADEFFGIRTKFFDGVTWARQYGGAAGILLLNGNDDLAEPIDIDTLPRGCLRGIEMFDRWLLGPQDLQQSFLDYGPDFRLPRYYSIGGVETPSRVHRSRMIFFDGERLDYLHWLANGMWHDSAMQVSLESVKDYAATMAGLATMFFEANIDVVMVDGLAATLSQPKADEKIAKRFGLAQTIKSMNRMLIMDAKDKYEKKGNNFTGLAGVVDKFETAIAAAARTPRAKLLGESPGGLGSNGDGEQQDYEKGIASEQEVKLRSPIAKWYKVLCRHLFGDVPPGFKFTFNALRVESKKEKADRELVQATTRKTYVDCLALPAAAVTRQLKEEDFMPTLEDEDVRMVSEVEAAGHEQTARMAELEALKLAPPTAQPSNVGSSEATPVATVAEATQLTLTPTMQGSIVTVNQALAQMGFPPWPGEDGNLTITEFQAKHGAVIAKAVEAEAGGPPPTPVIQAPKTVEQKPKKKGTP